MASPSDCYLCENPLPDEPSFWKKGERLLEFCSDQCRDTYHRCYLRSVGVQPAEGPN